MATRVIKDTPQSRLFLGFIFIVLAFLAICAESLSGSANLNYKKTTGVVYDYYMSRDSNHNVVYSEIARFEVDGRWYEASSKSKTSTPRLVGTSVEVRYDPEDPNKSYVYKKSDAYIVYIVGAIFGVVGVAFVVSGVKDFVGGNKKKIRGGE